MKKNNVEKIDNMLLKTLCDNTGKSLRELAKDFGIPYNTIYAYAKNVNGMPKSFLKQMQQMYKFSDAKMWQFTIAGEK